MERDRRNGNALVGLISRTQVPSLNSYLAMSALLALVANVKIWLTFQSQQELSSLLREELKNSSLFGQLNEAETDALSRMFIMQFAYFFISSPVLIWISINSFYALLALIGKFVSYIAFKELSRQEEASVRHHFFTFVLFNVVFVSVVAGAHSTHRVVPWLLWFGFCGLLSCLQQVIYQRFKFVSVASGAAGGRLSWLCFGLFVISTMGSMTVLKNHHAFSLAHFLFVLVDCLLAWVRSLHGLLRCLSSSARFGQSPDAVRNFNYWLDLGVSVFCDLIQFLNYLHLMFYSPLGFNLTCIFFFYHMKLSYSSIAAALARHQKHKSIFNHIVTAYPADNAPKGELCIVCWDSLATARRLPCGHMFHDWCLMYWLAADASCPTCRRAVSAPQAVAPAPPTDNNNTTYLRFGGGFGFLPSFSIAVSTGTSLGPFLRRRAQQDDSQLMAMAQQVAEMFPQLAIDSITEDLRISGSAQATIENVLEGRVGFVGGIAPPESDEESEDGSWHEEQDNLDNVADDSSVEEEVEENEDYVEGDSFMGDFARRKREMIAKYRKRYMESEKAVDLRERGISV